MRVFIEASSQEEFDQKRPALLKALRGNSTLPSEPRKPHYKAQKEILEHWSSKFEAMLSDLKREINEALE